MKTKEYEFAVDFHLTYGTFIEEAESIEEAYNKAWETIGNALKDLPVEVEFSVECVNEPDKSNEEEEQCCETCMGWSEGCSVPNHGVYFKYDVITKKNDYCDSWHGWE